MQNYQITYDYSTVIDQQGILRFKASGVPLPDIQKTIDGLLTTGIETNLPLQNTFRLMGNYPNPFNPFTYIRFELSQAQQIELQIFDSNGRLLRQLLKGHLEAGLHQISWDGRNQALQAVPSGTYFYRLSNKNQQIVKKMLLIK